MPRQDILQQLGAEIRRRRHSHRWTQRQLAEEAELSTRFVGDVERGTGNLSVSGLTRVAMALGCEPAGLLHPPTGTLRDTAIHLVQQLPDGELERVLGFLQECTLRLPEARRFAFVGLRGAGKSAVGKLLAERSGARFVELDRRIEEQAGLPLRELFEFQGDAQYRELERQALDSLLTETEPLVLATGGSLVTDPHNWEMLRRRFVTCWLHCDAAVHFERVQRQGDLRPMAGDPTAMEKLRAILRERDPLYRLAHHQLDTSKLDLETTLRQVESLAWPVLVGA